MRVVSAAMYMSDVATKKRHLRVNRYTYETWQRDDYRLDDTFVIEVCLYELEVHGNKRPTWRLVSRLSERKVTGLSPSVQLIDYIKNDPLYHKGYRYLDGVYANKPISKLEIVELYPECARMPEPIAMDYVRDNA